MRHEVCGAQGENLQKDLDFKKKKNAKQKTRNNE
jgi:hypothetical protein